MPIIYTHTSTLPFVIGSTKSMVALATQPLPYPWSSHFPYIDIFIYYILTQPSVVRSTKSTVAPATPTLATSHPYAGYGFPKVMGGASDNIKLLVG